ncbi:MAG: redoxin family protein [Deltaproteobacteria bacterium]|nr:redoxin family protein [Deltaproteobacteria bacterium]
MPIVNRLHNVIQEDPVLRNDVKVLGICAGNNPKQVEACKSQFRVSFPLLPDEKHEIHIALGAGGTPSMVLVNSRGKVLMNHRGVIRDFDKTLTEIRELHKKQ